MAAMEKDPSSYRDSQDMVKYISLDDFSPLDKNLKLSKLLPSFNHEDVLIYG